MKALVTGAAGFIGSHLSETLIEQGYQVTGVDDLSVGSYKNLDNLAGVKEFKFYQCDISIKGNLENLTGDFDYVFHLAALADIVPSIETPDRYMNVNVLGTVNILEHIRSSRVKKFVYAASSSCYGIPKSYPTSESAQIDTQYPYALSKFLGEQCVLHWEKVYGIPAISLRLFNVYGPRVRTSGTYGAVFGVFLAQRANGKPLTIVGDGSQTRDFTYVSDVVNAFVAASQSNQQGIALNVGSGGSYSVNDLAAKIGGETITIQKRPGEPDCTYADISKIEQALGWRPIISFDEGVNKLLLELDEWKSAPVWEKQGIIKATESWFKYLDRERSKN